MADEGSSAEGLTYDTFGWGEVTFQLEFVTIGDPGNGPDPASSFEDLWPEIKPPADARLGAVSYEYRIGKHEIPNEAVEKANSLGGLLITNTNEREPSSYWGRNRPATHMVWREWLLFVNWLNVSTGHHAAYRFNEFGEWLLWPESEAFAEGAPTLYRHKDSFYFITNADEWHKGAYYDPATGLYYRYPTGSNLSPIPVAEGQEPGTAVIGQPRDQGPADVDQAGGLSPYGTMGQGGNAFEVNESAFDSVSDSASEMVHIRGGKWFFSNTSSNYSDPWYVSGNWGENGDCCTIRVAAQVKNEDTDGDGMKDDREMVAGTDYLDPNAYPRLAISMAGENVELLFETSSAIGDEFMRAERIYEVEVTGNLAGGAWQPLSGAERIVGSGETMRVRIDSDSALPKFYRLQIWIEAGLGAQPARGEISVDGFGDGAQGFEMEFVTVGDPGNADRPADGSTAAMGRVDYVYRLGKHEVSERMIAVGNQLGGLGLDTVDRGPDMPATGLTWYQMAGFANWLNVSRGYHEAYRFDENGEFQLWPVEEAWTDGGVNVFRHKDALYFLPSVDEWYKAGFFDGSNYLAFSTGSNNVPTPVLRGAIGGTAVYYQTPDAGPAKIYLAGGLSPFGTMGQGGNVREFLESAIDGNNDARLESVYVAGGRWRDRDIYIQAPTTGQGMRYAREDLGFRVASRVLSGP